jgi:hypothetical protein
MDAEALRDSVGGAAPPEGVTPPVAALWWLARGGLETGPDWEKAHEIAQSAEGDAAHDWVHALIHRIEGDAGNAGYWYRRAGKPASSASIAAEWTAIANALLSLV